MTLTIDRRHLGRLVLGAGVLAPLAFRVGARGHPLRVGATRGAHARIALVAARLAADEGLQIRVLEFSDAIGSNAALAEGDLDANSVQPQPFLDQQVRERGYPIVSIGETVVFPGQSPDANVIAVRAAERDRPEFQLLLRAYRSDPVKRFVLESLQGAAIPTW